MRLIAFAMSVFLTLAAGTAAAEPTYRAFVSNERSDSVSVIDIRTNEVEATIDNVGDRPRGIGFSPDRAYVYVALGEENAIGVIDTRTLELVKKVPAGSDPEAFAVHPNGNVYLSNEDANLATALNPATGEILAEIPVGIEPEGVGVSPDGSRVMVTSESTFMVHVITVPEHEVIANVLVGARPREVAFSADGKWAYVTSEISGEVSKLDVAANTVVQQVKLDVPKAKPKGVVVSPDQKTLYVSTGSANMIAALNADTLELLDTVEVGKRVWGIALTRDGSRLYTCDGVSNTVSVVDTASFTVAAAIEVGEAPWGVIIDD